MLYLLAAVALAAFVWFLRELFRRPFSPLQNILWWTAKLLTTVWWRTELPKQLPLNSEGAVLICNHRSSIDPIFLQVMVRRVIHWMVAREFCESKSFGWFLRVLEVIPTRRGGVDTAATKSAIRLVENGGLLGVFPEGRLNKTDKLMLPGRPGAILIAIKARAPVIPCYIQGSPYNESTLSPLRMPCRVALRVGQPIHLDKYFDRRVSQDDLREITITCLKAIAELAGDDSYTPEIAGRKWLPDNEVVEHEDDIRIN